MMPDYPISREAYDARIQAWTDALRRVDPNGSMATASYDDLMMAEMDRLIARVRELETGLRHYSRHDLFCGHWKRGSEPLRPCTCGLAEILA